MADFWDDRLSGAGPQSPLPPGVGKPSTLLGHVKGPVPITGGTGGANGFGVHTVNVHIQFDATGEFQQAMERLADIAMNPMILGKLLQQAVSQTLVKQVRERFIQNLPNALEMESIPQNGGGGSEARKRARRTKVMERIQEAYENISALEMEGKHSQADKARKRLFEMSKTDWYADLNTSPKGKTVTPHKLSSGLFRRQAMHLMGLMTDVGLMNTELGKDGMVLVQIGNRKKMNEVKTPSATEHILGRGRTSSKYDIMWRHLEFGTGAYSKDPFGSKKSSTRFSAKNVSEGSDAPGAWWFAKQPPKGLLLKGSRGVHALRARTGQAYGEDVEALEAKFGELLRVALTVHGGSK